MKRDSKGRFVSKKRRNPFLLDVGANIVGQHLYERHIKPRLRRKRRRP